MTHYTAFPIFPPFSIMLFYLNVLFFCIFQYQFSCKPRSPCKYDNIMSLYFFRQIAIHFFLKSFLIMKIATSCNNYLVLILFIHVY